MMHRINLEMAWFLFIPRDAFHWDVAGHSIGALRPFAGQAGLVLPDLVQTSSDGGDADPSQLFQQLGRDLHLAVGGQMLCHPNQVGCETLGTDLVKALSNDPQGVIHLRSIAPPALPESRLAYQNPVHQPDQTLTVQVSDRFHLVQKPSPLLSASLNIALSHGA
jgi:hypothetical protein